MNLDNQWKKLTLFLIITAFLLYHPLTRQIVIFILPIGRAADDVVVGVILLVAFVFWMFGKIRSAKKFKHYDLLRKD